MFRTRDFILIFTTIAFLVMAIGTTIFSQWQDRRAQTESPIQFAQNTDVDREAVVVNPETISRAERLQAMREEIAEQGPFDNSIEEEVVSETDSEEVSPEEESEIELVTEELRCDTWQPSVREWSPVGVQIEEVEGARLVYREGVAPPVQTPASTASGSVPSLLSPARDVLVQLPLKTFPNPSFACISSDVIGIATDGSLIRNSEVGLYGIFSNQTLIGYALDGFPIYGVGNGGVDSCGGLMALDGYRYELQAGSETLITCFSGTPVSL